MKKIILLALAMTATLAANAQLKVDNNGIVQIGASSFGDADLRIKGTHDKGLAYSNKDSLRCGVECNVSTAQASDYMGIYSVTLSNSTDIANRTTAIKGLGRTRCSAGTSIGVWGCLSNLFPIGTGAGVLGSVRSSINNSFLDRQYAGFFNGITKVQGDFIVTGNIQGTLLGAPASSSSMSMENSVDGNMSMNASNSLKGLTANRFYHDISEETQRAINANNTKTHEANVPSADISEVMLLEENMVDDDAPIFSSVEKQILTKQHYGLDADQLEEVFPDLVYEDEDGTKSINYVEMVPILVQAINELKSEIDELKGNDGGSKKAKALATGIDEMGENVSMLSLGQNKPNPFGTSTNIEVSIPSDVQKAFIYVYDLTGKKLEQVDITSRGKQAVTINAASLTDGMYLYSLIADGKVVETRRMIVEK